MATAAYARALAETDPADLVVDALEITHPSLTTPVRLVNDTVARIIDGDTYQATAFNATLLSDEEGRAPVAAIEIDNIGRPLTRWIEASNGGVGATMKVMQVLIPATGALSVEWELDIGVLGVQMDQRLVTVRLGYEALLDRPAVALRYDLRTAPGLF